MDNNNAFIAVFIIMISLSKWSAVCNISFQLDSYESQTAQTVRKRKPLLFIFLNQNKVITWGSWLTLTSCCRIPSFSWICLFAQLLSLSPSLSLSPKEGMIELSCQNKVIMDGDEEAEGLQGRILVRTWCSLIKDHTTQTLFLQPSDVVSSLCPQCLRIYVIPYRTYWTKVWALYQKLYLLFIIIIYY